MTKNISEYTSEELYKLAEQKREEEYRTLRPEVVCYINSSDTAGLVAVAEEFLKEEENLCEVDTQDAYEALMEFVYGNDVWDYINGLGK